MMNTCAKYNNLLNKYKKLLFEKNRLVIRESAYLEAKYLYHFGDLMIKELEHNKSLRELKIKQDIYSNYYGLRREREIRNIQKEIEKQTELICKQIKELENKLEKSKSTLELREENEYNLDKIDELFLDVISAMHPDLYNLKNENLWERAKKAYANYDEGTLTLLKNLNQKNVKEYDLAELKNKMIVLENEVICMKKRYPYYLQVNLSNEDWLNSYNVEINDRIKRLEVQQKEICENLDEILEG